MKTLTVGLVGIALIFIGIIVLAMGFEFTAAVLTALGLIWVAMSFKYNGKQ